MGYSGYWDMIYTYNGYKSMLNIHWKGIWKGLKMYGVFLILDVRPPRMVDVCMLCMQVKRGSSIHRDIYTHVQTLIDASKRDIRRDTLSHTQRVMEVS